MVWVGHVAGVEDRINAYKILVRQAEEKTTCWWEDNIKIDLKKSCM
jgi:hypothetical protein